MEYGNECSVFTYSLQSISIHRAGLECGGKTIQILAVQSTNLEQLCGAMITARTQISKDCFRNIVESITKISEAIVKTNAGCNSR